MTLAEFLKLSPRGDLWIFGYGSLMWAPRFRYSEKSAARVHGYHYGTPRAWVEERLAAGDDVILKIDVQGGLNVKEQRPEASSTESFENRGRASSG